MSVLDISPFLEAKSDQIVADDLLAGPRSFVITDVRETGSGDQPVAIYLEGMDGKPFKPCKGMRRLLAQMWGKYANEWIGRTITLFRDPDVRFGAEQTGGVRIAAVSHIDRPVKVPVRVSKGRAKEYSVTPVSLQSEAKKPAPGKQTAEDWVEEHIGAVSVAASLDSLDSLIAKGEKAMGKLETTKPELWQRVSDAYAIRRAELEEPSFAEEATD